MNASPRPVLFRADASTRIGTGHVVRCLALAAALRELGIASVFVTRDLGVDVATRIRDAGHAVCVLPRPSERYARLPDDPAHADWAEINQHVDAGQTLSITAPTAFGAIIVDSYSFDAQWHDAVGSQLTAPIVVIDDLADRPLSAALIVDHNYCPDHVRKYAEVAPSSRVLGGPRHALLDPVYALSEPHEIVSDVRSIGIFMGGVDAAGLSLPIARALRAQGFEGQIEIATTSGNAALAELTEASAATEFSILLDAPNLAGFFQRHGLQIGAAGGAVWERLCIGVPTVAAVVAANQREVLLPLRDLGVVEVVSNEPPDAEEIATVALKLASACAHRAAIAQNARLLVDGRGAARVAQEIAQL